MREYVDIYREYCDWKVKKTKNNFLSYDSLLKEYDENSVKSMLYKEILKRCYDKEDGLYIFCKFILGSMTDIGYPKPFRYNKLLHTWDRLVKKHKYLAVECARGHGKSVFFSEILNLYDMFLFPHRRILVISASQDQANRILEELKLIIENNEWLNTKKSTNKWATETIGYNGGYILVKGIGSEILGQHVDRVVVDDILRNDKKLSDIQIEDYLDMTLDPMLLNRRGQMILVGTIKNDGDIFTTIEKRAKEGGVWGLYKFPAIIDYDKKILQCPDRFTWDDIMNKRLSMGPLKFAREYQLELYSRDTSLFPYRIIQAAREKGKDFVLLDKADSRTGEWIYVMGVDVARSGSASADYSVGFVLAYNCVTQAKQIVHVWRKKGLKITDQAESIADVSYRFGNPYILVEQNNVGQDLIDIMVDDFNLNVDSFVTGGKGQKKEELIKFLILAFEHEQIIMPGGDDEAIFTMDLLENELSKFCVTQTPMGNEKYEGLGAHDDMVMALALANRSTQSAGVPFALKDFGPDDKNNMDIMKGYGSGNNSKESDLVNLIRMGLLK